VVSKLFESGTYLHHFGSKDRLVDINNTLRDVHTQWKQLICDAEAHGRRLAIACRDDKRVTQHYVMLGRDAKSPVSAGRLPYLDVHYGLPYGRTYLTVLRIGFCHTGHISLCVDLFVFICVYFVCFCFITAYLLYYCDRGGVDLMGLKLSS